jgi:hypothetical protein
MMSQYTGEADCNARDRRARIAPCAIFAISAVERLAGVTVAPTEPLSRL